MLATTGAAPGNLASWWWELKWDGWRALVYVDGGFKVRTRPGREVSGSLPELVGLVNALDGRTAILDGELVACSDGRPDFYALTPRMAHTGCHARWAAARVPVTFVAFDLLHLDGQDLYARPLAERKILLAGLRLIGPAWAKNGWYCEGDTLFDVCAEHGHEGVVAKRLDSPYLTGRRSRAWLKRKCPEWKRLHAPRRRPRVPA
jgi:bifunctional non-homologous end joining protein LigD